MKRFILSLLTIAVACSLLITSSALAAKDQIKWRADTFLAATAGEVKNLQWFAELVNKRSGGRLKIDVYPGGSLGIPYTGLYRALKKGVIEMALGFPNLQLGDAPALSLDARHGIFPNRPLRMSVYKLLDPLRKKILEEDWGVKLLDGFSMYNIYDGIATNIDGKSWEDFKKKKLRAGSTDFARILEICGASAITMPLGETYQALKTGVIDGVCTSPRSVVARSLQEVAKYFIVDCYPGAVTWYCEFYVSKKHWDKLPADLQQIVQECATEAANKGNCEATDPRTEKVYLDKMRKSGMTVRFLPVEDQERYYRAAIQGLWESVEGKKDKRILEILEVMKPYLPRPK